MRAVANKLRNEEDAAAVRGYAAAHRLQLVAEIPDDEQVRRADRLGQAVVDTADRPPLQHSIVSRSG